MFTRLVATVTMSAPDAACACAITAWEGYLPVPTMSRDRNVRPAMTKGVSVICHLRHELTTPDEIDDLDAVALVHERVVEEVPLQDREVVLDSHAPRIDGELRQQVGDRPRLVEFVGLAVERDEQGTRLRGTSQRTARVQGKSR